MLIFPLVGNVSPPRTLAANSSQKTNVLSKEGQRHALVFLKTKQTSFYVLKLCFSQGAMLAYHKKKLVPVVSDDNHNSFFACLSQLHRNNFKDTMQGLG